MSFKPNDAVKWLKQPVHEALPSFFVMRYSKAKERGLPDTELQLTELRCGKSEHPSTTSFRAGKAGFCPCWG